MKRTLRIPTSIRLAPATVDLIKSAEKRTHKTQTEIIESSVATFLNLSENARALLESESKRSGKTETKLLEESVIAQFTPRKETAK